MWIRRLELNLMVAVGMVWIHGSPLTKAVVKQQIPEVAEQYRGVVARSYEIFDRELAGRAFFAGDAFTMADIVGLATLDFAIELNGLRPPEGAAHLARWHAAVSARPSAAGGRR
jgi:glutathione S-transferase